MNKYKILKLFFLIILFCNIVYCANPIKQKAEELKNTKVTLSNFNIIDYYIILFPPVPKVFFEAELIVENQNDKPITIEKFEFKISKFEEVKKGLYIAQILSEKEYTIPANSSELVPIKMETIFEQNPNKDIFVFIKDIFQAITTNGEMQILFEGNVEINTFFGKINLPLSEVRKVRVFKGKIKKNENSNII